MADVQTTAIEISPSPDPFLHIRIAGDGHSGISMTRLGAMGSIATLLALGEGQGVIQSVNLVHDGEDGEYRRFPAGHEATSEIGAI